MRIHTIPVYPGHTPEESWALIREAGADQDPTAVVPAFLTRADAGEEPRWANIQTDLSGRLIRVFPV